MKYSDEFKKKVLEEVLVQHERVCDVARRNGLPTGYLHNLVLMARERGIDSCLHSNRKGHYPDDLKLQVARYIEDGHSLASARRRFEIQPVIASCWYKKYAEGGADALRSANRGRILEQDTNSTDNQTVERVHTESEYRELEKRLKRAEMENKFLKKLDALVRERIERERKR